MRFRHLRAAVAVLGFTLLGTVSPAESHDPADYPLRLHIFKLSSHVHRRHGLVWWVEGNGRANLFANGNPAGVDFYYRCADPFMDSSGYETYPARWKRPNESLVILLHRVGSGASEPCELKVDVKNFVYAGNRRTDVESPEALKQWMADHNYDPEHGLDMPTGLP